MLYSTYFNKFTVLLLLVLSSNKIVFSQPELAPWGNLHGIRVDGHLIAFESFLQIVGDDWSQIKSTGKERQRSSYQRENDTQIVKLEIDKFNFEEKVKADGRGAVDVNVQFTSQIDTTLTGIYFGISLSEKVYLSSEVKVIETSPFQLNHLSANGENEFIRVIAEGLQFKSAENNFQIEAKTPVEIIVRKSFTKPKDIQILFSIVRGEIKKGETANNTFHIKAEESIDQSPISLQFNPEKQGRLFEGIGGNFRIQNKKNDLPVIDYCLKNLPVKWARVEMPWQHWHPEESTDPLVAARNGRLHPKVKDALEMAQRLHKMRIPVIIANWFAPNWAIDTVKYTQKKTWGNPLKKEKTQQIYASITSYLIFLKEAYGVEMHYFSFNESDLGIDVRQTDEEHTAMIKGLGAYFKSKGLKTKFLLGDTSDANAYPFINHAMQDETSHPYIGAVSFHSWRGWDDETLQQWYDAAEKMNLPLIVGEGSIDAAAWRYSNFFKEPFYAMKEINLYLQMLAICQPASILQWQLTSDYSLLSGKGILGDNRDDLFPIQRFWNIKQLAETSQGMHVVPFSEEANAITTVALQNKKRKAYTFHILNKGASREVSIGGLPKGIKKLNLYTTNVNADMEKTAIIQVKDGVAKFNANQVSFITLTNRKIK